VDRLIPARYLQIKDTDHEELEKEFADMIIPKYKKYKGKKRIDAQKLYLKLLESNPFFGSV